MITNALLRDPSRTSLIRKGFEKELKTAFTNIKDAVNTTISNINFFKFGQGETVFYTESDRVRHFKNWYERVLAEELSPNDYIRYPQIGHRQGVIRGHGESRQAIQPATYASFGDTIQGAAQLNGSRRVKTSMGHITHRVTSGLEGISNDLSTQGTRLFLDGIMRNQAPRTVAHNIGMSLTSVLTRRASPFAHAEVVRAHSEGWLDAFEAADLDKDIRLQVEWNENSECRDCAEAASKTYTIRKARGLIPFHPGCLCCWAILSV